MRANVRQLGQLDCRFSQSLMHFSWKTCWHSSWTVGLAARASRHMEQVSSTLTPSFLGPCQSGPEAFGVDPWVSPAQGATVAWPEAGRRHRNCCFTRSTILSVLIPDKLLLFWMRTSRRAAQISGLKKKIKKKVILSTGSFSVSIPSRDCKPAKLSDAVPQYYYSSTRFLM